jgi:PAS domain-containing protein
LNAALERMLGYTAAELLDAWISPDWELFDADLEPVPVAGFVGFRAVEFGEPIRDEVVWMRHRDGSWRCLSCSAFPFGWTDEVVVVTADLTEDLPPSAPRPGTPEVVHAG